jgi:hypothetical protein
MQCAVRSAWACCRTKAGGSNQHDMCLLCTATVSCGVCMQLDTGSCTALLSARQDKSAGLRALEHV